MKASRRIAVVAVPMALALGACGGGEDRPGQVTSEGGSGSASASASGHGHHPGTGANFSEAEADTKVDTTLRNFAFVGIPGTVKGPKVFFTARNEGASEHELVVVDSSGKAVAAVEHITPGKTKTLAAELPPGTYTVECHVEEGGKPHTELGMKVTLTVE